MTSDNDKASSVDAYVDECIMSFARPRFQKVAKIFGSVLEECEKKRVPVSAAILDRRLRGLIDAGRLESAGNVAKWRFSEVRLAGVPLPPDDE